MSMIQILHGWSRLAINFEGEKNSILIRNGNNKKKKIFIVTGGYQDNIEVMNTKRG